VVQLLIDISVLEPHLHMFQTLRRAMGTPRGLGTTIWILMSNPQITPSFTGKRAQILLSNGALMPFFSLQYKPLRTAKINGISTTLKLIQKG
jgi:hypothetical protein